MLPARRSSRPAQKPAPIPLPRIPKFQKSHFNPGSYPPLPSSSPSGQEDERRRRESEKARFLQRHEDEREIRLGAYAREHHGIPRLEEGLAPFMQPPAAGDGERSDEVCRGQRRGKGNPPMPCQKAEGGGHRMERPPNRSRADLLNLFPIVPFLYSAWI